jgi:hypothetical protein
LRPATSLAHVTVSPLVSGSDRVTGVTRLAVLESRAFISRPVALVIWLDHVGDEAEASDMDVEA